MTPLALNAALIACLGAGALDLTLLNLSVVPALYGAAPARSSAGTPRTEAGPERAPGPTKPAARLVPAA
ncbi:MAG TPA: hypothetical protein VFZ61_26555, partial [Polyangiales bacterium]